MAATNITEDSATSRTLAIPELLEHILSDLDMRTLLLAQRVSKQWQAVVAGSKSLQRALFFDVTAKDGDFSHLGHDGFNSFVNPNSLLSRPLYYRNGEFICKLQLEDLGDNIFRLKFWTRTRHSEDYVQETEISSRLSPSWYRMHLYQNEVSACLFDAALLRAEVHGRVRSWEHQYVGFQWAEQDPQKVTLGALCEEAIAATAKKVAEQVLTVNSPQDLGFWEDSG